MTFDWLPHAYWALIIGCFVTVILFAREPLDEPLSDDAYGDIPAIPSDFKAFHSATVTDGGQHNHGAR